MANTNGNNSGLVEETTTMQSAAGANGNGTAIALNPNSDSVMIKAVGSTAVLDVILEVDFLNAGSYESAFAENLLSATGIGTLVGTVSNPTTARYRYKIPPGATSIRARVLNFVSGTVTVTGVLRRWR